MRQRFKKRPSFKKSGRYLPVALVFPNSRQVGLSNLGFQFLWNKLQESSAFSPERFFVTEEFLKQPAGSIIPVSEENQIPLRNFPIIAFSIPFENDYPMAPKLLISAGIPPLRRDRGLSDPLVLAGGVSVTMNPEALADFLDLVFIGEIVDDVDEPDGLWSIIRDFKESKTAGKDRKEFFKNFRAMQGVYVPDAYKFEYKDDGVISLISPLPGFPERIKSVKRLSTYEVPPMAMIEDQQTEFRNAFLIEVNRGCGRGCRFCSGGWIHLPVRHFEYAKFRDSLEEAIKTRKTIGLVGSDLASHPELPAILNDVVNRGGKFSLSSIRPEGLTDQIIKLIVESGQKTATLAPEVVSKGLKRVIGKEIPSERFLELVEKLVTEGLPNIRFYFMIGLPTETDEDVKEIVEFVLKAREVFVNASRKKGKIGRIGVQVNAFVPKPWTPFQWSDAKPRKEWEHRIRIIYDGLRGVKNVVVRHESTRGSEVQAILSRADRRIANSLIRIATGGKLGPSSFSGDNPGAIFYAQRLREPDEIFPWDVVDHGVSKKVLRSIFDKAIDLGKGS